MRPELCRYCRGERDNLEPCTRDCRYAQTVYDSALADVMRLPEMQALDWADLEVGMQVLANPPPGARETHVGDMLRALFAVRKLTAGRETLKQFIDNACVVLGGERSKDAQRLLRLCMRNTLRIGRELERRFMGRDLIEGKAFRAELLEMIAVLEREL